MAQSEIVLYDLACTKNECFSPAVWRIRMMLNYKKVPYETIFLEFQDIAPTLDRLGITLAEGQTKYTVPAIYHVPSNTYLMDSKPIAELIQSYYPEPAVVMFPDFGAEIEAEMRAAAGPYWRLSVTPRELHILSDGAQEYFRRTREPVLGPLEVNHEKEEAAWQNCDAALRAVGAKMLTNAAEGPFVLGAQPSTTDFTIAGNLQLARVVDEGIFERIYQFPGFRDIYDACQQFMKKKD